MASQKGLKSKNKFFNYLILVLFFYLVSLNKGFREAIIKLDFISKSWIFGDAVESTTKFIGLKLMASRKVQKSRILMYKLLKLILFLLKIYLNLGFLEAIKIDQNNISCLIYDKTCHFGYVKKINYF
jgi:hypothetical protein